MRHVPGLNEELGATSAWGSQLAGRLPGSRYDGVLGHVVRQGARPRPRRRLPPPRQLRRRVAHGRRPRRRGRRPELQVVHRPERVRVAARRASTCRCSRPADVQDVLDLGLHAFACSRASGLWCGFKIVTSVADASGTADVGPDRVTPELPEVIWQGRPYEHVPNGNLLAPASLDMERSLLGPRTELAARLRPRERREPRRGRPRRLARHRRPPARPTTTCATRCAGSASRSASSSAPGCGSSSSA